MIKEILESVKFSKYFEGSVEDLLSAWTEPHRYFHTIEHLKRILILIESDMQGGKLSTYDYDVLRIAAIYHDISWLPIDDSINVKKSIDKFYEDFPNLPSLWANAIVSIIGSTVEHNFEDKYSKLKKIFNSYDMNGIIAGDLQTLIDDGNNVAKEFNLDIKFFNEKRIEFLEKYKSYNPNIQLCIDYLKN